MTSRGIAAHFSLAVIGVAAGPLTSTAIAHGMLPWDTPIDRLVTNLDARLEKSPADPELHYILGRLHALAFETGDENVAIWQLKYPRSAEDLAEDWRPIETDYWIGKSVHNEPPQAPTDEQLHVHLREALTHLNRAIELAPAVARYHLALASILESGEPMAAEIDVSPICPLRDFDRLEKESWIEDSVARFEKDQLSRKFLEEDLRRSGFGRGKPSARDVIVTRLDRERNHTDPGRRAAVRALLLEDWSEQITQQFFTAFALAVPSEGTAETQPARGWIDRTAYVSYEAATAYVRIVNARGPRPGDAVHLATARAALKAFDDLPPSRAITPILFSLTGARPLADLLDPGATTTFDLDGSGRSQRWPWVAHDTGILVWDPLKSGRITSGRQLFGSVSWWLFFKNGYDALAALDDDGDGELSGRELDGLAVWFDRNGNGQSDPGEVVPVDELGITGISCRATEMTEDSPCNPHGLRLSTGAILPTWDWITRPLPKAPAVSGAPGTAAPRSGA